jgi:hypothetical protein
MTPAWSPQASPPPPTVVAAAPLGTTRPGGTSPAATHLASGEDDLFVRPLDRPSGHATISVADPAHPRPRVERPPRPPRVRGICGGRQLELAMAAAAVTSPLLGVGGFGHAVHWK